jgi:hypothetical protein
VLRLACLYEGVIARCSPKLALWFGALDVQSVSVYVAEAASLGPRRNGATSHAAVNTATAAADETLLPEVEVAA